MGNGERRVQWQISLLAELYPSVLMPDSCNTCNMRCFCYSNLNNSENEWAYFHKKYH